jgi:hypothetical protein
MRAITPSPRRRRSRHDRWTGVRSLAQTVPAVSLQPPILSAFDPVASEEGGVDHFPVRGQQLALQLKGLAPDEGVAIKPG